MHQLRRLRAHRRRGRAKSSALAMIGRGFDVAVAPPFGKPLSEGLRKTARQCAEACPTGALALRTARSCDFRRSA